MTNDRKKQERVLFALTLVAAVLLAFAGVRYFARFDMTATRAFTLSRTARDLHKEIPEQLRITYFISKTLANKHPGPAAIEDFLREFEASSRGKARVRVVDPASDPSQAETLGIVPQQMQVVERDEQRVALVYTGIVIEYLDRYKTIPALISTETLEYELVKNIRALVRDRTQVAGLLVGDADKSVEKDYQGVKQALEQAGYDTREIQRGQKVEDDVTILYVLGGASMDAWDAYRVNAFVMGGGRTFFAVKGVNLDPNYGLKASLVAREGVLQTLAAWGMDVAGELVLDSSSLTVPFQTSNSFGGMAVRYVRYPHWVALNQKFVNAGNPMMARFAGLDLFWPSPIATRAVAGIKVEDLAKTTPKSWRQTKDFAAGPEDEPMYALEADATRGSYTVAVTASGVFPNAYAGRPLPARQGQTDTLPELPAASPDTRIVVVTGADAFTDLMRLSQSPFNASFAATAADWLSSDDDLIAIKSRVQRDTRLNRIEDPAAREFMILVTYLVTIGLVPALVIGYGVARSLGRKKRERLARAVKGGETA